MQSPSLTHGFMGDDQILILENPQITRSTSLGELLATDWFDRGATGSIGYYRPVTKLSFRATWALFGKSPFGFHLGNLLGHSAAVLALTLLLVPLVGAPAAALGATLYGVHPMTVQAVQNITARSDVLAGAFFLGTLAFVARWSVQGGARWLLAAAAAAALAIGSKESALLVPLVAGAVALALVREPRRAALPALTTAFAVLAGLAVRLAVVQVTPFPNPLAELGLFDKLMCVSKAIGAYVGPLVTGKAIILLPQHPAGPGDPGVLLGLAFLALLAAVVVVGRFCSTAALGAILLLASLAPALAIWLLQIPMWRGEIPVAERWLYLPVAGAAILGGEMLRRLPGRSRGIAGIALVAAFAFATLRMTPAYASAEAYNGWISSTFLASPPRNPREAYLAHFLRARQLEDEGRNEEALLELFAADRVAPYLPDHLWQIARLELGLGRPARAAAAVERFLASSFRADPAGVRQRRDMGNDSLERITSSPTWRFLSRARAAAGDAEGARSALAEAERIEASGSRDSRSPPGPSRAHE